MGAPVSIRPGPRAANLAPVHELLTVLRKANATPDSAVPCTLPLDMRQLTDAERLGAIWALDRLSTWSAQLQGVGCRMSDDPADALPVTPRARYIEKLRMVDGLACALQRALA